MLILIDTREMWAGRAVFFDAIKVYRCTAYALMLYRRCCSFPCNVDCLYWLR